MTIMHNKRGMWGMLLVVGGLFLLVMAGIILAIGSSVVNWTMDIAVPELSGLGVVGDFNATQAVDIAINPVNGFVQNFTWVSGLLYIFGLIGIFGIAFAYRANGDRWLIGLFVSLVVILVIGCIFLSNIYESVYNGSDAFSLIMQEHVMLSYLILYSPGIMSIIAFIAGIILFSESGGSGI
jgi:hypothetical protein